MKHHDATLYADRGYVYNMLGEYKSAIRDLTKAVELNPLLVSAYDNRGTVYKSLKDYGAAMRDYSKAIELKPDYARAYQNRGIIYHALKDTAAAMQDYDKAIELDSSYGRLLQSSKPLSGTWKHQCRNSELIRKPPNWNLDMLCVQQPRLRLF